VATDSSGNVYVADYAGGSIRRISPGGVVTTLAGPAGGSGSAAGGTGSVVQFNNPAGVAVNSSGNVYVAEEGNDSIRIGGTTLADFATIDVSTAFPGTTRLLDTTPQTATTWQWSVIRRPVDSAAVLSSESTRTPTFTPDVPGLFTFRLLATGPGTASFTTVDLTVLPQPPRRRAAR
jgi:DNA-binding beta-propeller fold protein YncE